MNNSHSIVKPHDIGRRTAAAFLIISALLFLPGVVRATGEPAEILLWPNGAPGSEGKTNEEIVRIMANGDHQVSSVHKPSITVFLPPAAEATGAAVIVAPGGGHMKLSMDNEGRNVARWLSEHGVAAFVLKYRLAKESNSTYTVDGDELADIQRAVRLVRSRAEEWRVNPDHLGVMGFSAGGELAFLAAMCNDSGKPGAPDAVDRYSCRPAFQALIYPGNLGRLEATSDSPPAFLACGNKDRADISEGLAKAYLKFKQAQVPAEIHIYTGVGHAFGLHPGNTAPISTWIVRFNEWLGQSGFRAPTGGARN